MLEQILKDILQCNGHITYKFMYKPVEKFSERKNRLVLRIEYRHNGEVKIKDKETVVDWDEDGESRAKETLCFLMIKELFIVGVMVLDNIQNINFK